MCGSNALQGIVGLRERQSVSEHVYQSFAASHHTRYSGPTMPQLNLRHTLGKRSWMDWIIFVALLTLFTWLGYKLSSGTVWIRTRAQIYQRLNTFGPPARYPQRTAIVLLDDDDYWTETPISINPAPPQLAGRSPTNRAYLAALINKLTEAHVGLIVLDFDMRSPDPHSNKDDLLEYAQENTALFNAIQNVCAHVHQIVLASELTKSGKELAETRNIYDSAHLPEQCTHKGYIALPLDIRRVPVTVPLAVQRSADSLALSAVKAVDPAAYDRVTSRDETDFPYSQFMPLASFQAGPHRTLWTGRDILNTDPRDLTAQLFNRIVLIGAGWHSLAYGQGPWADSHLTPSGQLPGVLVHANYMEAVLQNGTAKPFPESVAVALEVLLVLLLSVFGMLEIHWAWKWSAVLLSSVGVIVFSYLLLHTFGIMLDFFFPLIFVGVHSLYEHIREWRRVAREE
jgi:CHASE2 domain-containing sensor protein